LETTALGAAWLAGYRAGVWPDAKAFGESWARDRRFAPEMDGAERKRKVKGWDLAVRRTLLN
jgi:glycerol kinase